MKPVTIKEVIEVLSKTHSGKAIFHDCFIPFAVRADRDKIMEWLALDGLPEEYKKVLMGYLKWADKNKNPVHPVGGNDD